MAVETFTKAGNKAQNAAKLDKSVFAASSINHQLLKEAYISYLNGGRSNLSKTKTRGDVRGGGRKPWRQKGTGRARFGSSRNPIWTGGGVTFGQTGNENYTRKINVKAKRTAIRQALSIAATEGRIKIVDSIEFSDGRVKTVTALLKKINASGRILLVTDKSDTLSMRATRNIERLKLTQSRSLSVFDILNADSIVFSKTALEDTTNWLGEKKDKELKND